MLLMNKSVQNELKLTDEQKEKVASYQSEMAGKMREAFSKFRDLNPEEAREKLQAMMKEATTQSEKLVKEILKPEQARRLKQIELQQAGLRNFTNEETQKALQLTDEQKEKLETIAEDTAKDSQEIMREAGRDFQRAAEARKKVEALRKQAMEKANAVLTDEQKKALRDLMGEPFEVQFDRPTFPRPGGERPPQGRPGTERPPQGRPGGERPPERKPEPPRRDF
jgi:hypothetical protein